MNKWLHQIIIQSPRLELTVRKLVEKVPYSYRLGRTFWEWYSLFGVSQSWTPDQLKEFQFEHLRQLLTGLVLESSYYRERLSGVDISSIRNKEDFASLVPSITRGEYRNNYQEIRTHSYSPNKIVKATTSGTTGKALQFYHPKQDQAREWAAICHQWERAGYDPVNSRRVEFRGLTSTGKRVDYFPDRNFFRCSILNFEKDDLELYANAIKETKTSFFHGYPSAFILLVRGIQEFGIKFPQPEAILLASEMVYDWQLEQIQSCFPSAKIYAHYGCAERTVLAGWCETSREYHTLPIYSIVEMDPESSEIIGTNLYNPVNAFIRYRMTDTVLKFSDEPCPNCGRPFFPRFSKMGGRLEDYLYSVEHGWIPPAIVTYPLKSLTAVDDIQIVQTERQKILINYTAPLHADSECINKDLSSIQSGMTELLGKSTIITFNRVDDFERSPSGKFRWIVSKLENTPDMKLS